MVNLRVRKIKEKRRGLSILYREKIMSKGSVMRGSMGPAVME